MKDKISAEAIVEENFKGLSKLITDDDLLIWYKSLIVTCIESYHQQSLQQILEEAGEELPDAAGANDSNSQATTLVKIARKDGAKWMRSEASKVVAKWKEQAESWKWAQIKWRGEVEQRDKEIQQLKEELARKDKESSDFIKWTTDHVLPLLPDDEWYKEGYRYRVYLSIAKSVQVQTAQDVYKHYQASKTNK